MHYAKPTRPIPDTGGPGDSESADARRDRLVRELRELHAIELARAYEDGVRDGQRQTVKGEAFRYP